jgi:hypothetical protein
MLFTWLWLGLFAPKLPLTDRIGIPISKPAVLHFDEEIIDVELGNSDYHLKIKGKSLLLFANDKRAKSTTLFVRYGENKDSYVLEIYADEQAPLQRFIHTSENASQEEKGDEAIFPPELEQEYYDYGSYKDGIVVILTNIIHKDGAMYLRFFIDNTTSTNLKLSNFSFEYTSILRKFIFLEEKKRKPVKPLLGPSSIELAAYTRNYFTFSIPYYSSNGGLGIYLGESDKKGERDFEVHVPSKVLLQARRKK